jgi:hypothetical protein
MSRWGWVSAMVVMGIVIYLGCSPTSDVGGDGPKDWDRTNQDNLMNFFTQAYEDKDIIDYEDALDVSFLFQFTPDIAESLDLPEDEPWWGRTEDVTSTTHMFQEAEVTDIVMNYEYVYQGPDPWNTCSVEGQTESKKDTTFYGLCTLLKPDIKVTIETPGTEPRTLWVNNSWLDVMVVPDRFVEGLWTILRIEELEQPN